MCPFHQCYCGTANQFEKAVESSRCGTTYPTLCNGDSTSACGGYGATSVYERTGNVAPVPSPPAPPTTPAPEAAPAPTPGSSPEAAPTPTPSASPASPTPETAYSLMGCFADSKTDRIMENMMVEDTMSAEVCHGESICVYHSCTSLTVTVVPGTYFLFSSTAVCQTHSTHEGRGWEQGSSCT